MGDLVSKIPPPPQIYSSSAGQYWREAPTSIQNVTQSFTPGIQNTTQEFYIKMNVTDGDTKYNGWGLEAYHTGAATADPVFVNGTGSLAFLNGTNLQFDVSPYAFSMNGVPGVTNYARWEDIWIEVGYSNVNWTLDESDGSKILSQENGGWIVCEWYHDINAPQLFQLMNGYDDDASDIPSSCAQVLLVPEFI